MIEKPLHILVLACGGNVSHGILKALRLSALKTRVIGADIAPMKVGLYTADKALISPWAHEPHFMDWLIQTCRQERIDAILCGAEPVIEVLAENAKRIAKETGAVPIVSELDTFLIGDDKLRGCQWLVDHGFNSPAFAASEDKEEVRRLVEAHGFPLVAKKRVGGSADGLFLVNDVDDIEYATRKPGYILQQHIGDSQTEFTVGCLCDRNGALKGSIVFRRGLQDGTTSYAEVGEFPDVRQEAEKIVSALKPKGPCNVQLRVDDGRPVCFEINVRFSGTTPIRARLGFNEVDAVLRHFVLGEEMPALPRIAAGVVLRYWNEIYVRPEAYEALRDDGQLPDPGAYPVQTEDYGTDR